MQKGLPANFAGQALHRFLEGFVSWDRRAFKLRIQIRAGQPYYCRPDDTILTLSSPVCQLEDVPLLLLSERPGRLDMSPAMPAHMTFFISLARGEPAAAETDGGN